MSHFASVMECVLRSNKGAAQHLLSSAAWARRGTCDLVLTYRRPHEGTPDQIVKPNPKDMGDRDANGILYLNFTEGTIPERFEQQANTLRQSLEVTGQWLAGHAGLQMRKRFDASQLPDDMSFDSQLKRVAYRSKVFGVYLENQCSWIYQFANQTATKKSVKVEKDKFHVELIEALLGGIIAPKSFRDNVEAIFNVISGTKGQTQETTEDNVFLVVLNVIRYDKVMEEIRPDKFSSKIERVTVLDIFFLAMRTVTYKISQGAKEIISSKGSDEQIQFDVEFLRKDYVFRQDDWARLYNKLVRESLEELEVEIVRKPFDILP